MCAIFGFFQPLAQPANQPQISRILEALYRRCIFRGRDAAGYAAFQTGLMHGKTAIIGRQFSEITFPSNATGLLGHCRAAPTSEWTGAMTYEDVQPYCNEGSSKNLMVVHNGTIANDADFITQNSPTSIDSMALTYAHPLSWSNTMVGSVAAAAYDASRGSVYLARNYRPLALAETDLGFFFTSERDALLSVLADAGVHTLIDPRNPIH